MAYIAAELSDAADRDGRCKAVQHDHSSVLRIKAWTAQTRILMDSVLNGTCQGLTHVGKPSPPAPKDGSLRGIPKAYSV